MTDAPNTEKTYLVLINFADKHSNRAKQLQHCFDITSTPVAKTAVISYKRNNQKKTNPYDTDDRVFYYTNTMEIPSPTTGSRRIMDYFNNDAFTQGRFDFIVARKKDVILNANIYAFANDGNLPPPDNAHHHYQCEIDYQAQLKRGGFDHL